ncbi:amino acid adenylation domain-containing protein, partial [Streptomyces sp. NPDC006544]|uniref:non-ribosomal peptide synthetase n=1 Tax=Streptomyces sp. NPDC006544 TaxID=3154583 RepID=UPI0033AA8102
RDLSRTPLFQVMLALQNTTHTTWHLTNTDITPLPLHTTTEKFDLLMSVEERSHDLKVQLSYSTDLFEPATIERMAGHFQTLLAHAATTPTTPLSRLRMLTPAEEHQLLVEWNGPRTAFSEDSCIHELVEERAGTLPDNLAVVDGDTCLTYRELNTRANQLAHHLRDLGVGPEVLVGICAERSAELIIALLAVLKAGGVYVPLDPDYPTSRLEFMQQDTATPVVIVQTHLRDRIRLLHSRIVDVGHDREVFSAQPMSNPVHSTNPDNLAYVIYTSGSTGTPKGVQIRHRGVVNYVEFIRRHAGMTSSDVVAQSSTFNFDAFTHECWATLTAGATLAIITKDTLLDPELFQQEIRGSGITVVRLVASLFNEHLSKCPEMLAGTKLVSYGGEEAERLVADSVVSSPWAPANLLHSYGPTETTVSAVFHSVTTDRATGRRMPIGRPIANAQVYVVDHFGQLAPIGVPGELMIGGAGVARGYLKRPELTAEKFIANPFSDNSTEKLYRTGDTVRWLPDGSLEFLGRIDNQIKVRGFRIELGEIEANLLRHDNVAACVVVVREEAQGDRRLAAYCVPALGREFQSTALRMWCERALPNYMVPTWFVTVDSLPLTPNGKIDRQALPAPTGIPTSSTYVPPRSPLEENVAAVWREVLRVERVGVFDNFFHIGGNSILATRTVNRISAMTGIRFSLRSFFSSPTVVSTVEQLLELTALDDTDSVN